MTPRVLFDQLWARGDALTLVYDSLVAMGVPQPRADELLRAEWVARIAALDLFVHEVVALRMLEQFEGGRPAVPGFSRFRLSAETITRIVNADSSVDKSAAFDLDVRVQISHLTFQMPDKIAAAISHTSTVVLWDAVARHQNEGLAGAALATAQKTLKTTLSSMVERRNKIAHEGDLGPAVPRQPWPIDLDQIVTVRNFILKLVESIQAVLDADDASGGVATNESGALPDPGHDSGSAEATASAEVESSQPEDPPAGADFMEPGEG